MRTIHREIVGAVIFSKDGKILLGKKDPSKGGVYDGDCWHIPGGGLDEGETKEEGLCREIKEETGIDISENYELLDDESHSESEKKLETGEKVLCKMHFSVYKVELNQNADDIKVILDDDLVEYRWWSIDDLKAIKLTPPGEKLFKKLEYI